MIKVTVCVLLWCFVGSAFAQARVSDLYQELDGQRVRLFSIAGNGNSSGHAITAHLTNETNSAIRIDIHLSRPLYFVNAGSSQNMVAAQVYLSDGGYSSDGRSSFIVLKARARIGVAFVAFCADFDKDNPTATDGFSIGSVPPKLTRVMANISAYLKTNPNADVIAAAQAAVWLAQGVRISDIRERFPVTAAEERLARQFLR